MVSLCSWSTAAPVGAPIAGVAAEQSSTADYESLTKANSCTFPSRLGLTSDHTAASAASAAAAAAPERNSYSSTSSETRSHTALDSTGQAPPLTHTHKKAYWFWNNNNSRSLQLFESRHYLRYPSNFRDDCNPGEFWALFLITNLCDLAGGSNHQWSVSTLFYQGHQSVTLQPAPHVPLPTRTHVGSLSISASASKPLRLSLRFENICLIIIHSQRRSQVDDPQRDGSFRCAAR